MCDHCGCREVGPTKELTEEHDELLRLAWQVAEAIREQRNPDPEVLASLIRLHILHSQKEELGLFPLVLESGDCTPELIAELVSEHAEQTATIEAGRFDREAYYALAAHAQVEENEVFPMAMFGFDNTMWDDMERAHRAVEQELGR